MENEMNYDEIYKCLLKELDEEEIRLNLKKQVRDDYAKHVSKMLKELNKEQTSFNLDIWNEASSDYYKRKVFKKLLPAKEAKKLAESNRDIKIEPLREFLIDYIARKIKDAIEQGNLYTRIDIPFTSVDLVKDILKDTEYKLILVEQGAFCSYDINFNV